MIEIWDKAQIAEQFTLARQAEIFVLLSTLDQINVGEDTATVEFADGGSATIRSHRHNPGGGQAAVDIKRGPTLLVTYNKDGVASYEQGHYRTRSIIVKEYVPLRDL